jgi:rhodanese-related sulfurtransferase
MRALRALPALLAVLLLASASASGLFRKIHVADLAALMGEHPPDLFVYDANPPSLRRSAGIIPGAKLLPSSDRYDVAAELPPSKDATLVFYCANTH